MLPGKTLKLADVLEMAQRYVWLIVIPPMVMFFAALIFSSRIPNLYQSDMLIAIDPQRVPDVFVRSTVTMPTDLRMDALTVQALSRTALGQMIEDLDLYPEERKVLPMEDVVRKMRSNINVALERPREPQWGNNNSATAFHVLFTYPDPNVAAQVAQRIGSRFVDQNARDRGALAGATNKFLESQLADARGKLESQERRLESFRERHGKELPTQMQSNMQALNNAQLQVQSVVESIARDRDRKQMLERLYREATAEPTPVVTAQNQGAQSGPVTAQQQLATATANLSALELRYKPDHPDVVRAKRLISELEPKAAAEESTAAGARAAAAASASPDPITTTDPVRRENQRQMRAEIESLDRQLAFKESEERRIRAEITDYQQRVEAVPGLESEWVKLTRDYDTQQTAYKELLSKSTEAQVAADLEQQDIGERFRIVDPAGVPVRPLPSLRLQYNAGGLALGLLFGLGLAALLEFRDRSFRTDTDILEVLALPVLASVPRIETRLDKVRRQRRRIVYSLAGATSLVVAGYVTWTLKLWKSLI